MNFVEIFESDIGRESGGNRAAQLPRPRLPFAWSRDEPKLSKPRTAKRQPATKEALPLLD